MNTGLLPPAFTPFTFQRYIGVNPGFVGVAVKVTCVPEHRLLAEDDIEILAESPGLTVIIKSTVLPEHIPTLGVTEYVTTPAVVRVLNNTWLITIPESALNPVILPEVNEAVQ